MDERGKAGHLALGSNNLGEKKTTSVQRIQIRPGADVGQRKKVKAEWKKEEY